MSAPHPRPALPDHVAPGDWAPLFTLRNSAGGEVHLGNDRIIGGPVLLLFALDPSPEDLAGLADLPAGLNAMAGHFFAVSREPAPGLSDALAGCWLIDRDGATFAAYGVSPDEDTGAAWLGVLVGANRRVEARRAIGPGLTGIDDLLEACPAAANRLGEESVAVPAHAPVLVIPDILPPEACRTLIDWSHRDVPVYGKQGLTTEGFATAKGDFRIPQDTAFGRLDEFVVKSPALARWLDGYIARRALGEIHKAMQFKVSRHEPYRISRYGAAEGAFLKPHRDNPTRETAHRRFTLTINLNAGEYEGGGVRFPEYEPIAYCVPTGAGLVWSCSLLHEVLPVTAGERYMVGSHLY